MSEWPDDEFFPMEEISFDDRDAYEDPVASEPPLRERSVETIRRVLACTSGLEPNDAQPILDRVKASGLVLSRIDKTHRFTIEAVLELLEHEVSVLGAGVLDLNDLPVLPEYSDDVHREVAAIRTTTDLPTDPHALWQDLVESVQREVAREKAAVFLHTLAEKKPVSEQMKAHRALAETPPTTKKSVSRERRAVNARTYIDDFHVASAGRPTRRYSCGLPTLDRSYTPSNEPIGLVGAGEFIVVMGPTGTGKTSFSYAITSALVQDMINQGEDEAMQIVFHTEEATIDKIRGFRMDVGQRFAHLSKNLVVDAVGTSRTRMAEVIYDLVIDAEEWSRTTGRPIADKLPRVVQLDYIQSIAESADEKTETAMTAEFLLRGVCAWNPEEMKKFSGVDFREYAGMAWPKGMEMHRVGVIAYAQLVKVDDASLYYRESKDGHKGSVKSDFALLNDRDEPFWDIREGDLRLFGKNQMRGSGIIAQNANAILILHRSVPLTPAVVGADGREHLADMRARILFDKARSGTKRPYAPMRFDRQFDGPKAQYFDELAEKAIAEGILTADHVDLDTYMNPGDPILPRRPRVNPLATFVY
jgi:hypothetical protein